MSAARTIDFTSSLATQHAGAIIMAHLLFGTLCMSVLEDWTLSSAFYFQIVTLTTVGYGDLAPKSALGRLFTSLHILLGCTIAASCVGVLVSRIQKAASTAGQRGPMSRGREIQELITAMLVALAIILVGVLYASLAEGWGLIDSVYWAVVSCASVGFGDLAPSESVRPVVGVYLLAAVGGFASAAAHVTRLAQSVERDRQVAAFAAQGITAEVIEQIDKSGDGRVDRYEFLRFMLVAQGQIEETELQKLDALFDSLDTDGSGTLDADDMRRGGVGEGSELRSMVRADSGSGEAAECSDEAAPLNSAGRPIHARPRGPRNV